MQHLCVPLLTPELVNKILESCIITICMLGDLSCCCYLLIFFKFKFFNFFSGIRVSNGLDLDVDQCSVGPDLNPNCLQRSSADDKSRGYQGKR